MDIFMKLGDGPSKNTWIRSYYIYKRAHLNNVINKLYQQFFKILSVETSPLYILMLTYVFYYLLLFILCHLHYKPPGQPVFNCTRHMSALVRFMWRSVFDLHRFVCILPPTGSQTAHENQKQSVLFSYSRRFFNDTRLFVIYDIFFYKYLCNWLCLLILDYNRYPLYNVFNFVL